MSIFTKFAPLIKSIVEKGMEHNPTLGLKALVGLVGVNLAYMGLTLDEKNIQVKDKYQHVEHGQTTYQVVDHDNKLYNIPHSVIVWQWDVQEKWTRLEKGESYHIKSWGIRVPALGLFPRIYNMKNYTNLEN